MPSGTVAQWAMRASLACTEVQSADAGMNQNNGKKTAEKLIISVQRSRGTRVQGRKTWTYKSLSFLDANKLIIDVKHRYVRDKKRIRVTHGF